jgi:hypothetical protein
LHPSLLSMVVLHCGQALTSWLFLYCDMTLLAASSQLRPSCQASLQLKQSERRHLLQRSLGCSLLPIITDSQLTVGHQRASGSSATSALLRKRSYLRCRARGSSDSTSADDSEREH